MEQILRDLDPVALDSVMETLGTLVKIPISRNYFPRSVYAQLPFQWNHSVKDFGHAPTFLGRIDVDNFQPGKWLCKTAQLFDYIFTHNGCILIKARIIFHESSL